MAARYCRTATRPCPVLGGSFSLFALAISVGYDGAMSDKRHPIYKCPKCQTKIPFGTADKPAPSECPGCHRPLSIPTFYEATPKWLSDLVDQNQLRDSSEGASIAEHQGPVKRPWRKVLIPLTVATWVVLGLLARYLEHSH